MLTVYAKPLLEYLSQNKVSGGAMIISLLLFHLMIVTGTVQILDRYIGIPFSVYWAGEVTRTAMVFFTIVLLPYLFANQLDISFLPVLKQVFGARRKYVLLARNVFLLAFVSVMVYSSYTAYLQSGSIALPTLRWFRVRWVYLMMGVGFAGLDAYVLSDTVTRIQRIITGNEMEDASDV